MGNAKKDGKNSIYVRDLDCRYQSESRICFLWRDDGVAEWLAALVYIVYKWILQTSREQKLWTSPEMELIQVSIGAVIEVYAELHRRVSVLNWTI